MRCITTVCLPRVCWSFCAARLFCRVGIAFRDDTRPLFCFQSHSGCAHRDILSVLCSCTKLSSNGILTQNLQSLESIPLYWGFKEEMSFKTIDGVSKKRRCVIRISSSLSRSLFHFHCAANRRPFVIHPQGTPYITSTIRYTPPPM